MHSVIPCIYKRDYSTGGKRRGGELKCYRHTDIQTYRHTDRHTDRPSDEAVPRGAFALKNSSRYHTQLHIISKRVLRKVRVNESIPSPVKQLQ